MRFFFLYTTRLLYLFITTKGSKCWKPIFWIISIEFINLMQMRYGESGIELLYSRHDRVREQCNGFNTTGLVKLLRWRYYFYFIFCRHGTRNVMFMCVPNTWSQGCWLWCGRRVRADRERIILHIQFYKKLILRN